MNRLPKMMQHIISGIHHIVLGLNINGFQTVFQPFGRLFNFNPFNTHSYISATQFAIFYNNALRSRAQSLKIKCLLLQYCCPIQGSDIASNSQMRSGISSVRCQSNFKNSITLNSKIICCQSSNFHRIRKNHDSIVPRTQSHLIFSANHALTQCPSNFTFSDGKRFFSGDSNFRAHRSYHHFLTRRHIWCAANNI